MPGGVPEGPAVPSPTLPEIATVKPLVLIMSMPVSVTGWVIVKPASADRVPLLSASAPVPSAAPLLMPSVA